MRLISSSSLKIVYYISNHTESLLILTKVMARILTSLLLRHCTPLRSPYIAVKSPPLIIPLSGHHRYSSFKPQLIEIDLGGSSSSLSSSSSSSSSSSADGGGGLGEEEEEEALLMRKLEEIIHRVMLQRSTPDWLPFIPGSSFWVPPERKPLSVIDLVEKLNNRLSDEESLALTTSRGWPSSFFFCSQVQGVDVTVVNSEGSVEVKVMEEEEEEKGEGEAGMKVLGVSGAEEDVEVAVQVLHSESEVVGVPVLAGSDSKEGNVNSDSKAGEAAVQVLDSKSEEVEVSVLVGLDSKEGEVGSNSKAGEVTMPVVADWESKEVEVQGGSDLEYDKVELQVLVGSEDGEG